MMTSSSIAESRHASRSRKLVPGAEVALIGVAADRSRPSAAWTAIDDYADLLSTRTPIRTMRIALPRADARAVVARISHLPASVATVFVVGLGPSDSTNVQRCVAARGGPLVVFELDLVTVALAAAATGTLRRNGIPPRHGRIVVAEPERAPRLGPILLAASGASTTSWYERDAAAYPLRRVMSCNDILIDLAGTAPRNVAPGRIVTLPSTPFAYGALALPGLLSAVSRRGQAIPTLDVLASCTRALTLLTSTNQVLPELSQRLLIPAVTRHAARAMAGQPHPTQ